MWLDLHFHLQLSMKISTLSKMNFYATHQLPLCMSTLEEEQQNCCPLWKMFSWRGSSHRNLSMKEHYAVHFLRDSSPTTLSPFFYLEQIPLGAGRVAGG